jgi:hypothetical protein
MRYNKEITVLIALGALAASSAAQQVSGTVIANASVSGGSHPGEKFEILKPGQTKIAVQTSDSGPSVTAVSSATAQAGYVTSAYSGRSNGNPYGSGYTTATFTDAVRLTGNTPMSLTFHILQSATCYTDGSDPGQTSAGNYGDVVLQGNGLFVHQLRQESSGGFVTGGGFQDVTVTLQPNKWYRLYMQVKAHGDTSDSSKPYTDTNSVAYSSLTSWFEPAAPTNLMSQAKGFASFGGSSFLESASGYDYSQPNPQAVPEPTTMAALAIGSLGILRRRRNAGRSLDKAE